METNILTTAPLVVQLHVAAALPALILGPVAIWRRKRDWGHRLAGRLWVLSMVMLAGTSLFIHEARLIGPFSPIHLLSLLTFVGLWQGLRAIRQGDVMRHQRAMRGLYIQALVLAGVFTFLPGRRMNALLFGAAPATGFVLMACLGAVAAVLIWRRGNRTGGA
jgi:uncharacterized membrane protein